MEMFNTKRILIQIEKSSKSDHTKMTENKNKNKNKNKNNGMEWNAKRSKKSRE
jgi:hypothetical protein